MTKPKDDLKKKAPKYEEFQIHGEKYCVNLCGPECAIVPGFLLILKLALKNKIEK